MDTRACRAIIPDPGRPHPVTRATPLEPAEPPHLLAYLAAVPDPRAGHGRRHPLVAILAMAAAAVLTGARSLAAIAEWAADSPQPVRAALGARREAPDYYSVPSETTIRRTLARLDAEALTTAVGAWLADRHRPNQRRRALAVDGKTLRGSGHDGRQVHLLAAMEHASRRVLAQREVDGAPGEVPGFAPLLAPVDLTGVVVTADALRTHREHADWLVEVKHADYVFTVKANQPTLLDRCAALPWHNVPELDRTRDHAHGRVEIRTLKAVSVRGFGFPHAAQVLQVTRKVRYPRIVGDSVEVSGGDCGLPPAHTKLPLLPPPSGRNLHPVQVTHLRQHARIVYSSVQPSLVACARAKIDITCGIERRGRQREA